MPGQRQNRRQQFLRYFLFAGWRAFLQQLLDAIVAVLIFGQDLRVGDEVVDNTGSDFRRANVDDPLQSVARVAVPRTSHHLTCVTVGSEE